MHRVARSKDSDLNLEDGGLALVQSAHVRQCMATNWPGEELQNAILLLLAECWEMFIESRRRTGFGVLSLRHTKVSHGEFTGLLDRWLAEFVHLEASACSSCPF